MSDTKDILDKVAKGEMTPKEAELQLKMKPFVDLGFAKPDLHRGMRQGVPEVIFGQGKTPEQIDAITKSLLEAGQKTVLITRLSAEKASELTTPIKYYDVPLSRGNFFFKPFNTIFIVGSSQIYHSKIRRILVCWQTCHLEYAPIDEVA